MSLSNIITGGLSLLGAGLTTYSSIKQIQEQEKARKQQQEQFETQQQNLKDSEAKLAQDNNNASALATNALTKKQETQEESQNGGILGSQDSITGGIDINTLPMARD